MRQGGTTIPSWAYILIGASMMVYSKFIESRAENTSLAFFFYIGLGGIIFGLGKIALKKKGKEEIKRFDEEKKNYNQNLQEKIRQQQMAWQKNQEKQQSHPGQHHYNKCMYCGTPNYAETEFCTKCGQRMR